MRKGIEAKQSRNISETVVFADKLFAFVDFQFDIVVYYRFAGALAEVLNDGKDIEHALADAEACAAIALAIL